MINRGKEALVLSNKWETLYDRLTYRGRQELCTFRGELSLGTDKFNDVFDEECRDLQMKKDVVDGKPKTKLPRKIQQLLSRYKGYSKRLAQAERQGSTDVDHLRVLYSRARNKFRKEQGQWKAKQRELEYSRIADDMASYDFKSAWTRLKARTNLSSATGEGQPMKPSQPLKDDKGHLQTSPEGIQKVMSDHYKKLLQDDKDGQMREYEYWRNKFPYQDEVSRDYEHLGLSAPMEWPECLSSIREMNGGTSPSEDELHIDVFKGMVGEECMAELKIWNPQFVRKDNIQVNLPKKLLPMQPRTPMGKVVFHLLNSAWELGDIPEAWEENTIVSLFKKGDPELLNNYRGVTLISVLEKILTGVMMARLYGTLESAEILDPEQAGFRPGEEAIGQFIALAEIVRRRGVVDEKLRITPTFGIFIDFKKAYDKVPHGMLWVACENMGIKGHMLHMIKALYKRTRVAVRAGGGNAEAFDLWRGLRQGCLLSPILFIIFVTNLLQYIRYQDVEHGVDVPHKMIWDKNQARCLGLLYADDVVGFEGSIEYSRKFISNLYRWREVRSPLLEQVGARSYPPASASPLVLKPEGNTVKLFRNTLKLVAPPIV
ncbi:hypothetical protein SCP_1104480 [Sparassis crispa]|uniref:Reverse transcriptase domain-containing protein n=1 Tax=Sparassis crispa TaxID=139825 RepID=A0A401H031_9APHY|nr:hypothetical protein SCP_1104480 [Sparassis crispa]GBE87771.1 hypothetical protein SCP_1104480 [Sparassis crispa]